MAWVTGTNRKLRSEDSFWVDIEKTCHREHGMSRTKESLRAKWQKLAKISSCGCLVKAPLGRNMVPVTWKRRRLLHTHKNCIFHSVWNSVTLNIFNIWKPQTTSKTIQSMWRRPADCIVQTSETDDGRKCATVDMSVELVQTQKEKR